MALTAWRIGYTAVTCDSCGAEATCAKRASGYAVLLAAGWTEQPSVVLREGALEALPQSWPGEQPMVLLCPSCSRRTT